MAKTKSSKPGETKAAPKKQAAKKASAKKITSKTSKTSGLLPIQVKLISSQTLKFVNGQEIAPNYKPQKDEKVTIKKIDHFAVFVGDKQQTQLADKTQCKAWAEGIAIKQQNIYQMHLDNGKTTAEAIQYTNQRYM